MNRRIRRWLLAAITSRHHRDPRLPAHNRSGWSLVQRHRLNGARAERRSSDPDGPPLRTGRAKPPIGALRAAGSWSQIPGLSGYAPLQNRVHSRERRIPQPPIWPAIGIEPETSTPKEVNHDTSFAYVAASSHHHRCDRHPRLVAHNRPGGHYGEGRRLNGTRCRTAALPAGAAHPHEVDSARAHETQPTPYNVRTMSSIAGSSKVRSTTSVTALTSARTLAAVVSLGLKASRCRWPSRSLPI